MAQSISLSVETPPTAQITPSILPSFGHQRRYSSQNHKRKKNVFCSNTLPSRSKQESRNQSTLRRQVDVIRYIPRKNSQENTNDSPQIELQQNVYFHNVFSPGIHSTPLYRHKDETHNGQKETSSSSLNNIKQSTQGPPHSSNIYLNDYELFKSTVKTNIPSISQKVDMERQRITGTPSLGLESKVIKRRGICGVSWILRLALKDTSVGKIYKKQIGWIILILIIFILIGGLLVHFSSHFTSYHLVMFTNFTQVPPKIVYNENTTKYDYIKTTTPEPMYSEDANRPILPITRNDDLPNVIFTPTSKSSDVGNKTSNKKANLKTEYIAWREGTVQNSTNKLDNYTNELMEFCKGCRKGLDICIAVADSGVPVCRPAMDLADPTGCGGLCALEIEACHLLNQKHLIYTCRPLETLQLCEQDEWRCENLLCIPKSKRCDGYINCYDRSDETECSCNLAKSFHCGNHTSCLDNTKRCDGTVDCWDGSDELNCTIACPDEQFTCNNGECIERNMFCDGLADCADKTDEPHGCEGVCGKKEFRCTNKRCIPKSSVCNGTDNCGDMSDELNCPNVRTS